MLELGEYELDMSAISKACKNHGSSRVALQVPAIFARHTAELSKEVTDLCKVETFVIGKSSYGACDLPDTGVLRSLGVDLVITFGHSQLPDIKKRYEDELKIPTVFIEMPVKDIDITISDKDISKLGKTVGLSATVQYVHLLPKMAKVLEEHDIDAKFGEGDGRIKYAGQVLGCNYSSVMSLPDNDIDSYLFVGSGTFHPLGIALSTPKPTYAFDPLLGIMVSFQNHRERFLRKRYAMISSAQDAGSFAVVICSKPGQFRMELALKVKEMLLKHGKEPVMYISDDLDPMNFDYSDIDAIVSTACPRIAFDDSARYKKPIITPIELEIVLGERKWEDYLPDMIMGA